MYKVIVGFMDLQDGMHEYHEGDPYPRDGAKVNASRINDLSTSHNLRGVPLIESTKETPPEAEEGADSVGQVLTPGDSVEAKEKPKKGRKK